MPDFLIIAHSILAIIAVGTVIMYGSRPSRSLGWILIILILPFAGTILYLLFGVNRREFKLFTLKHAQKRKLYDKKYDQNKSYDGEPFPESPKKNKIATLLFNSSGYKPYKGNKVSILDTGTATFTMIFDKIKAAKKYVFMQYFIIEEGELFDDLCNIIEAKTGQGVLFRILYDTIGSRGLSSKAKRRLRDLGVALYPISPFTFGRLLYTINYRNHRKIIVIDDEIGFTGGFNLSDKYIRPKSELGVWKDDHVCIEGPAVRSLLQIFIKDYYFASGDETILDKIGNKTIKPIGNVTVQIISGGPDYDYLSIMHQYLTLISNAMSHIYIANPYFIPSRSVLQALVMASLSGVEVAILVPKKSDSRLTRNSMYSYFNELLSAGIKIYLDDDFLHSKVIVVDDEVVSVGSGNFDHRSFEQNYETNALIYDKTISEKMSRNFVDACKKCHLLSLEEHQKRPLSDKVIENFARLFSPLL